MNDCKDFEKALMLDVFGELDPEELPQWAAHAAVCAACRAQREQLARMMHQVKGAATPAPLGPEEAARLNARIRWAIHNAGRAARPERKIPFWKGFGPKPAWAFGMLLCLVLAVGGVQWKGAIRNPWETDRPASVQVPGEPVPSPDPQLATVMSPASDPEDGLPEPDREILENFDFLKEMETIRKLVQAVDQDDDESGSPDASDSARPPMSLEPRGTSHA